MAGIKCIGILTSGGDAPGMNAAIRAVTRSAIFNGFTVKGIMRGYKGLVFNEIVEFKSQSVSNIIQLGGTILKTARSQEFTTPEGRKAAYDNMVAAGIDALVVIGGDGSLTGAGIFAEEFNVPIVGLPGTIDNDLGGTDSTIGYDTALNTIMEAVDKLRDTASSHERLFFVEVMGHTAGYLALNSAIATGSEAAIILYAAHAKLEEITLDKETSHYKNQVALKFGELVYNGQWYTPLRKALSAFVDKTQENVTGDVTLKLYKGNMINAGVVSPYSLYSEEIATFDEDHVYDQKDSAGFINLFGLPIKVAAKARMNKDK